MCNCIVVGNKDVSRRVVIFQCKYFMAAQTCHFEERPIMGQTLRKKISFLTQLEQ
jgi:hypothetical protein